MFASGTLSTVTSGAIALSAGAATQIALNAGNNQTVAAGSAVPIRPSVIVRDGSGNPVAGVAVTFSGAPGNGTIPGPNQTTHATGNAPVPSWAPATPPRAKPPTATPPGATGTAGAPTSIAVRTGNSQSAEVGTAVTTPPAVIVQDQFNNPVASVAVTFAPAAGSGTVNPTTPVTTGPGGIAAVSSWTLGTTAGPNTLTATAAGSGITGNPVTFTATGTAGAAAKLAITTQPSATARSGVAFLQQPVIQLQDASGNPVSQSGTPVTATIASGGGTLGGTPTVTTNTSGTAVFTNLSITGTAGPHTLGFSAPQPFTGVTSGTVSLTAGAATRSRSGEHTSESRHRPKP